MWHPEPFVKHPIPATHPPTAEEAARSLWFSPLRSGRLELTERTWVPAMVPWRATDDGLVTPEVLAWYDRFARGQPGALVVEATAAMDRVVEIAAVSELARRAAMAASSLRR